MSIRIGASCVAKYGGLTEHCKSAEIRYVKGEENHFLKWVSFCRSYNIYIIANLDQYKNKKEHYPLDLNRLEGMMQGLEARGCNKKNCRITVDNEPMKYISKEVYAHQINQVYSQVKNRFYVGAGNEEFGLSSARGNMYQYILEHSNFDYLDIHIQASVIEPKTMRVNEGMLNYWCNIAKNWANTYKKKLSCTEANWMNISKLEGYQDLLKCLIKAEEIGCEDFNIVFITLAGMEKYKWISFIYNGKVRSPYWNDFKRIMKEKAPIIEPIIEEEDMKLKLLQKGSRGNQVKWLQEILEVEYGFENAGGYDGILGKLTEQQIEEYQNANDLDIDLIVGKDTMSNLINKAGKIFPPRYWFTKLLIFMSYE